MTSGSEVLSRLFQWESSFDEGRPRPSVFHLPVVSDVVAPFLDNRVRLTDQDFRGVLMQILASTPISHEASVPPALAKEPWQLLYGTVSSLAFVAEEPLRSRLDTSTDPLHEVYRVLWEIRFAINEGDYDRSRGYVASLMTWVSGGQLSTEHKERLEALGARTPITGDMFYDTLCCLLALARQNDALTHLRLGFEVDAIKPTTDKELKRWVQVMDRWVSSGPFPVGVLLIGAKTSSTLSAAYQRRR